jgi:uncharacterized membrane protein YgaE (UPF0421/DUF939 family)
MRFLIPIPVALAATLAYLAATALSPWVVGEPQAIAALWAVISAILVVQDSVENTLDALGVRILGSAIGCLMSLAPFWAFHSTVNAWSIGFCVVLTCSLCVLIGLQKHMRLACITLVLILLLHQLTPNQPLWYFALWRFFYSVVGCIIGVSVRHFFSWATQYIGLK